MITQFADQVVHGAGVEPAWLAVKTRMGFRQPTRVWYSWHSVSGPVALGSDVKGAGGEKAARTDSQLTRKGGVSAGRLTQRYSPIWSPQSP
jgi:hypothetical protein